MRARDLGIVIGRGRPGPANAITDVAGVTVGHTTLIRGDGPLVVGEGPVRTGVTMIVPHDGDVFTEPLFAGSHTLNGNGELTGLEWIREGGLLTGPIGITNTHSVGVVRDGIIRHAVRRLPFGTSYWALPVVGETWDGLLNDIDGFHVSADHVDQALAAAGGGAVEEGGVGGGTGMVCHEFKGGIGTASRVVDAAWGGFTVGVLVQANYGRRDWLRVDGVPVGEAIPVSEIPSPYPPGDEAPPSLVPSPPPGSGSIIAIVATDAPLLPHQCERLAQRAGLGIARMGGTGAPSSGDLFLCFATGNRSLPRTTFRSDPRITSDIRVLNDFAIGALFDAVIESTEESIVNALVAAETMTGRDGITAYALPHDRLLETMARFGRGPDRVV
ncbi:MAG TPA: P1 family peptidase [Candidatus Limnocylindrales bacterium]|nr:P1 family peptidase [Candidatus Limnocylindrales bacterium]